MTYINGICSQFSQHSDFHCRSRKYGPSIGPTFLSRRHFSLNFIRNVSLLALLVSRSDWRLAGSYGSCATTKNWQEVKEMRLGVSRRTDMALKRLIWTGPRGPTSLIAIALMLLSSSVWATSSSSEQSSAILWGGLGSSCSAEDPRNSSVSCHGVRIVRRVVQQLLDKSGSLQSLELSNGVTLVETPEAERSVNGGNARSARRMKIRQDGPMGQLFEFLEGRELRVKLPSLLPDNLEFALKESLPSADQGRKGGGGGLGGGKKGDGGMLLMALMMGKMMSALGFGALGLLAMKALMVSALALMLSLIVAAKKLAGGHDDGGGHHVVYAQEVGHHHRKRSASSESFAADYINLPYRGYAELYATRTS